jgi:hypothetical protein
MVDEGYTEYERLTHIFDAFDLEKISVWIEIVEGLNIFGRTEKRLSKKNKK